MPDQSDSSQAPPAKRPIEKTLTSPSHSSSSKSDNSFSPSRFLPPKKFDTSLCDGDSYRFEKGDSFVLCEFVSRLHSQMTTLLKQNDDLISSHNSLISAVKLLAKENSELRTLVQNITVPPPFPSSSTPSYAQIASRPVAQIRQAIREEASQEIRCKQVLLKNLPECGDFPKDRDSLYTSLTSNSAIPVDITLPTEGFRLGPQRPLAASPRPLVLTFATSSDSLRFMKLLNSQKSSTTVGHLTCRSHYCPSDLTAYKVAWAEAIKRNNDAKLKLWTVRNLKLVKVSAAAPTDWVVKERKAQVPQV